MRDWRVACCVVACTCCKALCRSRNGECLNCFTGLSLTSSHTCNIRTRTFATGSAGVSVCACVCVCMRACVCVRVCEWVSELEFNVPFQHKHGYIRDESVCEGVCVCVCLCLCLCVAVVSRMNHVHSTHTHGWHPRSSARYVWRLLEWWNGMFAFHLWWQRTEHVRSYEHMMYLLNNLSTINT